MCTCQEEYLKEANLAGGAAFSQLPSFFFWPETPAAVLKHEVNLIQKSNARGLKRSIQNFF